MQKTLIAVFLFANLAFSNAVFLKKTSNINFDVVNRLREIDQHPFGNKLMDTLALQLTSNAPMSDIAKLLRDLISSNASQIQSGTHKHNKFQTEITEEIEKLTAIQNKAQGHVNEAQAALSILTSEISQLTASIRNLESQIGSLNAQENNLRAARARDAEDFERRQQQGPGVIEALELIIEKLNTIEPTEDGRTVLAQLSKIGASNPIASLLQIASTFSKEALQNVITKISDLRTSL